MRVHNTYKRSVRSGAARCALAAMLASVAVAAQAQDAKTNTIDNDKTIEDIIVTGTLIRGAAPTGTQVLTITSADIAQLGVSNTSQLLGSLPQDASFNNRPQVGAYGPYQSVNAPLLRYLGGNASGSNSTLLLVDGVRLPGMGISQTSADIDAIAPGALERVETATDGGSATYGADAVGGVVNLITRKRFDGLQVNGHFGGADNYRQYDVGGTAGKTWSAGSVWVSYQYAHNDMLYAHDRDYVHDLNYATTPFTGNSFACNPGNFVAGGYVAIDTPPYYELRTTTYPIVNGQPVAGTPNTCDVSGGAALFPAMSRHSVLAGADIDLASWLTFDVKAYYTHRDTLSDGGANLYNGVPATACTGGAAICASPFAPFFTVNGTVSGSFEPSFGPHTYATSSLDTWAVIPRLTAKLGHDWQLMAFLNVGDGFAQSTAPSQGGDAVALAAEVANGSFNPFTGLFANTPAGQAAQAYQAAYYGHSSGKDVITNTRAVLDGPLFTLPGGDVRAAIGGEYFHETFTQRNGLAELTDFASIVPHSARRSVKSAFGELSVPIVGEDNRFGGVYSLTLSAAGRYDDYSDFGSSFNPKFAVTLKPTSWWTLRGNWGKSFQAPSLASTAAVVPPGVVSFPAGTFGANPAFPNTTGLTILLLYPGGGVNLRPQKATTWEVGTDIKPTFLPGFSASVTYYNIDFQDRIATPSFFMSSFYSLYPDSYIMNSPSAPLTSAQIAQYIAPGYNAAQFQQYVNNPGSVYALENGLSQNLSSVKTTGLDFDVRYSVSTGFGSIFGGVGGSYVLTYDTQATPTSTFLGADANNVQRLRTQVSLGTTIAAFLAKATWNRSDGFAVQASAGNAFQSHVKAFNTINLAFQYAPKWDGALEGLSFNLNADNVLDTDPPVFNGGNGNAHGYFGFTLGRLISFGIEKKF